MEFGQNAGPRGVAMVPPIHDPTLAAYIRNGLGAIGEPPAAALALTRDALQTYGRSDSQAWTPDGGTHRQIREALSAGGLSAAVAAAQAALVGHSSPASVQGGRTKVKTVRGVN